MKKHNSHVLTQIGIFERHRHGKNIIGIPADHSLANLSCYRWQKHFRGLYQTPIAA